MVTETVRNYEAMSEVGASIIFADAMKRLGKGERYNLGLATGNTMITLYTLLADKFNRAKADLSLLSTWNLDANLMPRYAATMGMAPILAAKKCLLLACFTEQTAPLKAIFAKGAPTPFLPASYLWRHPDYHLVYTTDKIKEL